MSDFVLNRLEALRSQGAGDKTVMFPKYGARLHAMVTSAGYDRCTDPSYDWHGLRRGREPYVLLQHTISGRGHLSFDRKVQTVLPGQTMMLRFPHDHRYWLARGDEWEFFWLCLNGREVLRIWRDAMTSWGPVVRVGDQIVDRLGELCLRVMQGEANSPARASAIAYQATMEMADALLPWGAVEAGAGRSDAIRRAVVKAQKSDALGIRVANLAIEAGYSRHHFSRLFSKSEGVPPARYLLRLRMDGAIAALRTSSAPIKTIARQCGFEDPNYFGKVFRRFFGVSPREFRANGHPSEPGSHNQIR